MPAARDWYAALAPDLRDYIRKQVLALSGEPTDEQIEELPDLIKPAWRLDMMQISAEMRPPVLAAIAELAAALEKPKGRRR